MEQKPLRMTKALVQVAVALMEEPEERHYGYELAKWAGVNSNSLYQVLGRMVERQWLTAAWEQVPEDAKRPPRRYYTITQNGMARLGALLAHAAQDRRFTGLNLNPPTGAMNELVSVPISPWYSIPAAVGLLALTFVFAPGVLLHLAVLPYPRGHDRRQEFRAELEAVSYLQRPFWTAGVLVRCLFEGMPARMLAKRARRKQQFLDIPIESLELAAALLELAGPPRFGNRRNGPALSGTTRREGRRKLKRLRQEIERRRHEDGRPA